MFRRATFLLAGLALATLATSALAAPSQVHLGWDGPTDTTVTVTWRSTESSGVVSYGETPEHGRTATAVSTAYAGTWLHVARLTGLDPETTYHYRAGAGESLTPDRTFTTGPAPSAHASFRFAAYGDSRSDDAARARVRAAIQARGPAFSVDSGDLVADGNDQGQWDEWFATMEPLLAVTPFVSIVGNHEVNSARFYDQFTLPRRSDDADGETYASWDYGNVHFLSLNTEIAYRAGSAQYAWLEQDLARASADPRVRWIVAVFHRPPYSSGSHGSEMAVREAWSPLFERYGVDVVFNGHDHHYERSHAFANGVPQPDGGVVYVVTGGAGAPLYGVVGSSFTAFSKAVHHFVEVDVTPTTLSLEAIDTSGTVFDSVTLVNDAPLPPDEAGGGDDGAGGGGVGGGGSRLPDAPSAPGGAGCGLGGGPASLAALLSLLAVAAARRRAR